MDDRPRDPACRVLPRLPAVGDFRREDAGRGKRSRISTACGACRSRKSKCDGQQPQCGECITRDTRCQFTEPQSRQVRRRYEQLRDQSSMNEELISLLKNLPENDAIDIVRRLREGGDARTILNHVKGGNMLIELSLVPESPRIYELPYLSGLPAFTMVPGNPYLSSVVYGSTCQQPNMGDKAPSRRESQTLGPENGAWDNNAYTKPYWAAEMVDPLLEKVTASKWTGVISDDKLFRQLLAAYFMYQHPSHFYFHKDLFLEDMASGITGFCSTLLVNAVLAAGCQSHSQIPDRYKFWMPQNLGYQFLAEAKRLWELELLTTTRLTTIQAACMLNNVTNLNGMDKVGSAYYRQALEMARELKLFDSPKADEDNKATQARCITAWSFFSWQVLNTYHFFRPPDTPTPPKYPFPNPVTQSEWYGDIRIRYPLSRTPTALQMGSIIVAKAHLHTIINEIGQQSFKYNQLDDTSEIRSQLSLGQALSFKQKLDIWLFRLPEPFQAKNIIFPAQFELHCEYLMTISKLFRPHMASGNDTSKSMATSIVHDSRVRIETLIRLYYLRHSFDFHNSMFFGLLVYLQTLVIEDLRAENEVMFTTRDVLLSTLILCAKNMESQGRCYRLSTLTSVALQSLIKPEDLQFLQTFVTVKKVLADDESAIAMHSLAQWPLPIVQLHEDPTGTTINELIQSANGISLETQGSSSTKA